MNIFRLTGDLSHLAAIIILLLKIWKSRSCAGACGRPPGGPGERGGAGPGRVESSRGLGAVAASSLQAGAGRGRGSAPLRCRGRSFPEEGRRGRGCSGPGRRRGALAPASCGPEGPGPPAEGGLRGAACSPRLRRHPRELRFPCGPGARSSSFESPSGAVSTAPPHRDLLLYVRALPAPNEWGAGPGRLLPGPGCPQQEREHVPSIPEARPCCCACRAERRSRGLQRCDELTRSSHILKFLCSGIRAGRAGALTPLFSCSKNNVATRTAGGSVRAAAAELGGKAWALRRSMLPACYDVAAGRSGGQPDVSGAGRAAIAPQSVGICEGWVWAAAQEN